MYVYGCSHDKSYTKQIILHWTMVSQGISWLSQSWSEKDRHKTHEGVEEAGERRTKLERRMWKMGQKSVECGVGKNGGKKTDMISE